MRAAVHFPWKIEVQVWSVAPAFCPVSGENASQKNTPSPCSQPTMSFDVVGKVRDATKSEQMCCPNVRQEVGAMMS
jgi:hypothetical protein